MDNLEDYVILPGRDYGRYTYPDLLVAQFSSKLSETFDECEEALWEKNSFNLTIRQYVDFLNLLIEREVYDGAGNKLDKMKVKAIAKDIFKKTRYPNPVCLDARFTKKGIFNKKWNITYNKIKDSGKLTAVTETIEESIDLDNKDTEMLDLNFWIANATYQGLPPKTSEKGDELILFNPLEKSVAYFSSTERNSYLILNARPDFPCSDLRVRAAKIRE